MSLAPGGPEMRSYSPSLLDWLRDRVNDAGRGVGYPDLAQRTGDTGNVLLGALGFALPGAGGTISADRAIAKQLMEMHPFEATREEGLSAFLNTTYPNSARAPARIFHDPAGPGWPDPRVTRPGWLQDYPAAWHEPGGFSTNDSQIPLGPDAQKYMNAQIQQLLRKGLGLVDQ